jgi:hypothetical protein
MGSIFIEVDLKVKGTSDDKTLLSRVLSSRPAGSWSSRFLELTGSSKFSTLEFTRVYSSLSRGHNFCPGH